MKQVEAHRRDQLPHHLPKLTTTHANKSLHDEALSHIVVVGGGAAGLELVARRPPGPARPGAHHAGGKLPNASLEADAGRRRGGQHRSKRAPTTAVMTSNVTHFAMDVGEVLLRGNPADVVKARNQAARTLPVIVGFAVGCCLGAVCAAALGTWSLALPTGLALLAFAMAFAAEPSWKVNSKR